ncbi:MAG TPA: hypothetical protein VH024_16885, partial [Candidatus Angelobacter sp.]|nr:hypothetical protein [Candidatus Angelobacter sp.]
PKQLAAALERGKRGLFWRLVAVILQLTTVIDGIRSICHCAWRECCEVFRYGRQSDSAENGVSSTGC